MAPSNLILPPPVSLGDCKRFWSKVRVGELDECWPWLAGGISEGYGGFKLSGRVHRSHVLARFLATGEWPGGLHTLHSCDNPPCCNPAHLRLGTDAENAADRVRRRRQARGERSGRARLTTAQVVLARWLVAAGLATRAAIAAEWGVDASTVGHLVSGKTWRHVPA